MGIKWLNKLLSSIIFVIITISQVSGQDTIKIMPLGNSITEGITDGSLTNDQLRGYRYGLRYLLKNYGYKVDFVGSQTGGSAYFSDCQHAGIGGSRDQYVVRLLTDGYDQRHDIQILVPPRYYLDEYDPDIILLHIGTNDITHEGDAALTNQKITDILNMVDQYETRANKEVIVFLALIVNRAKPWLPGSTAVKTTSFNNGIKSMALARIASGDKIVIVDMENDAGFEYSTAIDLTPDGLHPNELGYSKMAALWFSSITSNINTAPKIAEIPDQSFNEGGSSGIVLLDNYVTDIEDPDQNITWTTEQLGSENLIITINENRQAIATAINSEWSGSQTVVFTATDMGKNGKYIKSDHDTVVFTVIHVNKAPVITSTPLLEATVGNLYSYVLTAADDDNPVIILSAVVKPPCFTFSEATGLLTGTPSAMYQGQNQIVLRASDGLLNTDQNYTLTVNNPVTLNDTEDAGFYFYPVPAQTYLVVEFGNLTGETLLQVINTSGIIVQKIPIQVNQYSYRLDLNRLENGIYYLRIINKSFNYLGKFSVLK